MRRDRLWILACLAGALVAAQARAEEKGHIQIQCEAGVQVLLDGLFRGVTNADVGGLILQDVAAGPHRLKAAKAGCALPTEAQWEYACRADSKSAFYFGDEETELGDHGWYSVNSGTSTHPVGEKKPNPWGLYDLYGNVWEWTGSPWMNPYDGSELKGAAAEGAVRVLRGASWMNSAGALRSAQRAGYGAKFSFDIFGVRLACPVRK